MANQILSRTAPATGVERHADQQHAALKKRRLGAWGWRLAALMFVVCAGATVAAQDRVILFDSWLAGPMLKWQAAIREFEISDGGREWRLARTTELPPHLGPPGVALADGSRILWLAWDGVASSPVGLAQYELRTGRTSFVDVGPVPNGALFADRKKLRLYIVSGDRITFIDERLRQEAIRIPASRPIAGVRLADDYIVLRREETRYKANDGDLVFINLETREAVRTVPFRAYPRFWTVSRDGQRVYSTSLDLDAAVVLLDLYSGATGELLVRKRLDFPGISDVLYLDEVRNTIVHDNSGGMLIVRDALTLAAVGELGPSLFHGRFNRGSSRYQIQQTVNEKTFLVQSQDRSSSDRSLYQRKSEDRHLRWDDVAACESHPVQRKVFADDRGASALRADVKVRATGYLSPHLSFSRSTSK